MIVYQNVVLFKHQRILDMIDRNIGDVVPSVIDV